MQELDDVCAWCVEELVCEIFDWEDGDFEFLDGDPIDELRQANIVETGSARVQTTAVVMEATRRQDEWKQIRELIQMKTSSISLIMKAEQTFEASKAIPKCSSLLRYLDGRHHIDAIARHLGMPRFDVFAILANLVVNRVARPRDVGELLDDALQLRQDGELDEAVELLESALTVHRCLIFNDHSLRYPSNKATPAAPLSYCSIWRNKLKTMATWTKP